MGLSKLSGGATSIIGRIGQMPKEGKPYSRIDMYDEAGNLIQQRWFGPDKKPLRNRDWKHGN